MVDSRTVSLLMNVTEWFLPPLIVRMIILCWLNAIKVPIQPRKDWDTSSLPCWRIDICTMKWWNVCWLLCTVTFLTSQDVLKMQFLRSTALEIYTASSYDVDKMVSIVRSDFRCPKLVKATLTRFSVYLFTWTGCEYHLANESMTRVLVPGTGVRDALCYSDETQWNIRIPSIRYWSCHFYGENVSLSCWCTGIDRVSKQQDESCTVTKALHTLPRALHKRSQRSTQHLLTFAKCKQSWWWIFCLFKQGLCLIQNR